MIGSTISALPPAIDTKALTPDRQMELNMFCHDEIRVLMDGYASL
jgi:hypothetical protein